MALNKDTLKTEILKLIDPEDEDFVGYPEDAATAAENWAAAYATYAADAEDASGDALASASESGFADAIESGLAGDPEADPPVPGSSTPAQAAAAFGAAFLAFWTGATFAVGTLLDPLTEPCPSVGGTGIWATEATSAVLAAVPAGLITLLTAEFAVNSDDPDTKADALATAFHTATTTAVTVLISGLDSTPPPASPIPITNTCTVF